MLLQIFQSEFTFVKIISLILFLTTFAYSQYTLAGAEYKGEWSEKYVFDNGVSYSYRFDPNTRNGEQIVYYVEFRNSRQQTVNLRFTMCNVVSDERRCYGEMTTTVGAGQSIIIKQTLLRGMNFSLNGKAASVQRQLTQSEIEAQQQANAQAEAQRRQYEEQAVAERRRLEEQQRLNDGINAEMARLEREAKTKQINDAIDAEMSNQKKGDGKMVAGSAELTPEKSVRYRPSMPCVGEIAENDLETLIKLDKIRTTGGDFVNCKDGAKWGPTRPAFATVSLSGYKDAEIVLLRRIWWRNAVEKTDDPFKWRIYFQFDNPLSRPIAIEYQYTYMKPSHDGRITIKEKTTIYPGLSGENNVIAGGQDIFLTVLRARYVD